MNSLDLRFSKSILTRLYDDGSCLKTTLQDIVKNLYSLDKLLAALNKDELINIDIKAFGKNIQEISLTPKGRVVAEQLKRAEEAAKGKKFDFPDKFAVITFLDERESLTLGELKEEFHEATEIVRELESLKVIRQEIDNSTYPPVNRIVLTEKGEMAARKLKELEEILKG